MAETAKQPGSEHATEHATAQATEHATEQASQRKRINLWIVIVLLVQIAVPLRYYLGLSDGDDERFSWRMFSTVRLQRCDMSMSETRDGSPVPQRLALRPILQSAWIAVLQRYRPAVVASFLRFRCQTEGVATVSYERRCVLPDQTRLPPTRMEIDCDSGVVREVPSP